MKKLSLVLSLVLFTVGFALAQRTVTGTVTDDGGEPLIGASIFVRGTSSGTVTDIDGSYSLEVPEGATTLVVSYTGFETRDIKLGVASVMDITLSEGVALDEVVVTGLGIRREKKALGYAVTTLNSSQLELRPEADVARVLRGKVPGVDITQTSGLAGSGTNVIIRGYSSITGSNQPLFVVDGVPFNSDTSSDRGFDSGGASASSRFLDLDPNSIAEVSVLKGLSATVLYGEAGRNGVILITTKNGASMDLDKKFEVTIDQSLFANDVASLPDDQDSWGNGFHNFASAAFSNWGANFNERTANDGVGADGAVRHPYDRAALNGVLPQYIGARYPYTAKDNLDQFFQTGTIASTSVNIANRLSEGTTLNFNYGYRSEEGFIPLSTYDKHNFGLGINSKLSNGLMINSTFNYVTSDRQAPPVATSFSSNPGDGASLFSNVFYTPRSIGLYDLEYENPQDFSSIFYRGGNDITHPLWTLNNTSDNERLSRFFGTVSLSYKLTDWLSAMYRLGYDGYSQRQRYSINKGGGQIPVGLMSTSLRNNVITDHNFNLQYNTRLSDDLTLDGVIGANIRRDTRERTFTNSTQQFVYGLLVHDNFINHVNQSDYRAENLLGVYATASVGFKNFLYLNVQARNDLTSTLEKANRSVFYPSASVSFIPTEAFTALQGGTVLNYLKLRLGYGTSAGYPDPYQTRNVLGVSTRDFVTNGGTVVNTNTVDNRFGNPELKPELHSELEFGLETRLFNNRLGIDLSLYNKQSKDLIIDLNLDPSTGYQNTTINAAEISNKGIELGVDLTVVQTSSLRIGLNGNFTRNVSNVEKLADGINQLVFAGYSNIGNFAIVDQPYGIIQGAQIARDANGNRIVQSNGTYLAAPDLGILGDPNARYVMNGGLNVNFKGINLNALFSYSDGGVIYATTPSTLMGRGVLAETDFDRYVPVIAPGVKEDGTPNDIQITSTQHYWQNGGVFNDEMRVYDASYMKLREVSISYSLPKSLLDKSPFGTITFTASGQNLWFKALGFPAGANFDPEVQSTGVGNGRGFELMNVPTSKQIGGSVRLTF
ncbi:MAG: SusC/RagA family TonB-linked outer membrane protein [Bacteroidetes bacterium]|nr:MAG: SusC/RagA family TonB-linked outer membrane protein [Bacteroidota bacterium]PTM11928.1 MAG: SusC/RagA family TonB-linked outer membrane protein [Bacteroidota bacterium]